MTIISNIKKVVLYLRYSSSAQTEQSIEGQDRVCTGYCKQHDYMIIDRYIDRAKSASHDTAKRTEFLRMIKDAKSGKFDAVVVYKLDRFARDRYDSAIYKAQLKQAGVQVLSATEAISDGPESVIMESLLEGMAEYYSLELSQKVKRGIKESVEKRRFLGGPVPLGLKPEDGKLVPDPETDFIIREIFEMADAGFSIAQIIDSLNGKGYRNRRGLKFQRSSLKTILHSKKYIGFYTYDGLEVADVIEPILDEELFWRVQERLKNDYRRKKHKNSADDYLLTGKIFCGKCGTQMLGESGSGKSGKVYRYYKCFSAKQKKGCDLKAVRKDDIEQLVISKAKSLLTEDRIHELADALMEIVEEHKSESKIPALENQLKEIETQISNGVNAVLSGISSPALTKRIQELEAQKEELEISLLQAKSEEVPITREMAVFYLESIRDKTESIYGSDKALIDAFIKRIEVYEDQKDEKNRKIRIFYTLSDIPATFENCSSCFTIRSRSEIIMVFDSLIVLVIEYSLPV